MFHTCKEAVSWVTSRRKQNHALSHFKEYMLENTSELFDLKVIHVAGTNGKGSTCNFITDCLLEAGYRVGMFTSPHLIKHQDRITINHQWISDEDFLDIVNQRYPLWEKWNLGMFEIDVDIMAVYFSSKQVDFVVLETGLGGLDDSTNIIEKPLASVIVSIGMDHMERLGSTLEEIAYQKAGIIKYGCPIITAEHKPQALNVIKEIQKKMNAPIHLVDIPKAISLAPIQFEYHGIQTELKTMAQYQISNACTAIETLCVLKQKGIIEIDERMISCGISKSQWAGRFEIIKDKPLTIVDGAHNEHGVDALAESIRNLPEPRILVFAALKDKSYPKMIKKLHECADKMIITSFDFYRAASVNDLNTEEDLMLIKDWKKALIQAEKDAEEKGTVIITGSLYFISEVIAYFKNSEK